MNIDKKKNDQNTVVNEKRERPILVQVYKKKKPNYLFTNS